MLGTVGRAKSDKGPKDRESTFFPGRPRGMRAQRNSVQQSATRRNAKLILYSKWNPIDAAPLTETNIEQFLTAVTRPAALRTPRRRRD